MSDARQRIDIWLFRARLCKTRAEASRLISEGGVRLMHNGQPRRLEKPSVEVEPGDVLVLPGPNGLRTIEVKGLGLRRGPATEARALYREAQTG